MACAGRRDIDVGPLVPGLPDQELELPHLVAALGEPGEAAALDVRLDAEPGPQAGFSLTTALTRVYLTK